jgi:3-phenylpropionate/cinnamic acid dioxygenase small subunit
VNDRGEIENLMALYTEALDDARFDALGALFAAGTVTIEGGPHSGATASGQDDVTALYRSIVVLDDAGRTGTRHFITNVFVETDGDTARARSYFAVTQQTAVLPLQIVACGAYRDEYRRDGARWRFAIRHIVCDQMGDLSRHMQAG